MGIPMDYETIAFPSRLTVFQLASCVMAARKQSRDLFYWGLAYAIIGRVFKARALMLQSWQAFQISRMLERGVMDYANALMWQLSQDGPLDDVPW